MLQVDASQRQVACELSHQRLQCRYNHTTLHLLQVEFMWSSSEARLLTGAQIDKKNLHVPGPLVGLTHGSTVNFTLSARFAGATAVAQDWVQLTVEGSALRAALKGPSGDVRYLMGRNITFDASASMDPDDPVDAVAPMRYDWSIRREVSARPGPVPVAAICLHLYPGHHS